jgi:surfeit locus 1 family protein
VPIKFGSRSFAPRPLPTLLTIVLIALLISLGRWQLRRAEEKRLLFDAFAAGTDATRVIDLSSPAVGRYRHIQATGHYDSVRQILIDNMTNADGQAGYFVITPFALAGGGWVLVNRGWVPVGDRAQRPAVDVGTGMRRLRGRADNLPQPGIRMGTPAPLAPPYPVVADFPTTLEIAQLLHEHSWTAAAQLVLLDAGEPDGYLRQWQPPGFPPMRNVGYAVQWFALALTLFVIYIVTNLRRDSDRETPA